MAMTKMTRLHARIDKACCLFNQRLARPNGLHPLVSFFLKVMIEELLRSGLPKGGFDTIQQIQDKLHSTIWE